MSKANMKFDLDWALRLLDDLEKYIKQDQKLMARGAVQKVRETLETYGRIGREGTFERLIFIENNIWDKEKSLPQIQQVREEIQAALKII